MLTLAIVGVFFLLVWMVGVYIAARSGARQLNAWEARERAQQARDDLEHPG